MEENAMKCCKWLVILMIAGTAIVWAADEVTDKTLVSWVSLDNLTQRGGSVLTIQYQDKFDAIVFGEKHPVRWMAGSNFFCTDTG